MSEKIILGSNGIKRVVQAEEYSKENTEDTELPF